MKYKMEYQGRSIEISERDANDVNLKRTTMEELATRYSEGMVQPAIPPSTSPPLASSPPNRTEVATASTLPFYTPAATRSRAQQVAPNNPFHSRYVRIDDYITMGLRMKIKDSSERLVYEHLCLAAWKTGGHLSNNTTLLRHLAGVDWRQDRFDTTFEKIRHLFDLSEDGTTLTVPGLPEEFQVAAARRGRVN